MPVRARSPTPYWTLTIYGGAFQPLGVGVRAPAAGPTTPVRPLEDGLVWAVPGSLATTTGISLDFSSSGY